MNRRLRTFVPSWGGGSKGPLLHTSSGAQHLSCLSSSSPSSDEDKAEVVHVSVPTLLLDMDQTLMAVIGRRPLTTATTAATSTTSPVTQNTNEVPPPSSFTSSLTECITALPVTPTTMTTYGKSIEGFDVFHNVPWLCRRSRRRHHVWMAVDIVVRPHVIDFLAHWEDRYHSTTTSSSIRHAVGTTHAPQQIQWRICTANNPQNCFTALSLFKWLLDHRAGLVGRGEAKMASHLLPPIVSVGTTTTISHDTIASNPSIVSWVLQRATFGVSKDEDKRTITLKAHHDLRVPRSFVMPSLSSTATIVTMQAASFSRALLFDDNPLGFDHRDYHILRRCVVTRPFLASGKKKQVLWSPPTSMETTDSSGCCMMIDEAQPEDVEDDFFRLGGVAMKLMEAYVASTTSSIVSSMESAALSATDFHRLWHEVHDDCMQ